jgi:MoaA/NifB/PqqE/SkfB family radical SAM enzyme
MVYPVAVACENPELYIYWQLTDFCNFRCNYCPPFLHNGDHHKARLPGFPTDEEIIAFLDRLEEFSKTRKINVALSGGEPTLHPMLPYIVSRLRDKCFLSITSNGTRGDDFWKEILPISSVQLSLHPEFTKANKINSLSKIVRESGTPINYNLSCDPANWDNMMTLYNEIDDEFKPLIQPKLLNRIGVKGELAHTTYDYNEDQYEWMEKTLKSFRWDGANTKENIAKARMIFSDGSVISANKLGIITLNEWHDFKGWKCSAGSESICVTYSGKVFSGICRSIFLGKIDNFKLYEEYIICPQKRCVCPSDIRVNKRR